MNAAVIELRYAVNLGEFSLDVDLRLPMRGITGVFGASGSGKTSLLRCIAGLANAPGGRLVVAGEVWQDGAAGITRPVHEREVAYVFQESRLFSHLDVQRNLEYGIKRRNPVADGVQFDQVVDLLELQGLLRRRPGELSGGEAQRVSIARALLRAPRFVLMDEPLAALDRGRKDEVLPFLDRLHAELAIPIVYVSHSIDEICRLCDHLVVLEDGRCIADGALPAVLSRLDLPILNGEEAGAVLDTTVAGYDSGDDLTRLRFSGGEFLVAGNAGDRGAGLRLRIRANDISLCRDRPAHTTILNIVPVEIEALGESGDSMMLARLKAGSDRLLARISRRSAREMELVAGDRLLAQIKSAAIRNRPPA
jgi:molybdate transport system ATP-binding protein